MGKYRKRIFDDLRGRVERYRDRAGFGCDAVLHLPNGKYALVEIKLGGDTLTAGGVAVLGKLKAKVGTGMRKTFEQESA